MQTFQNIYEHFFMFKSSELLSMITAFFSIANQELKIRNIIFFYDNLPRMKQITIARRAIRYR